jgi:hypothetical protein
MNDMLARAACDFKNDATHRQNIAKDIENEIAIAQCGRRILAVVAHSSWRAPRTPTLAIPMEQEFVAKRRKRALGHTRALPRPPPPDGKRPLFPAIFPNQLAPIVRNGGDGRSGALHDALGHVGTAAI